MTDIDINQIPGLTPAIAYAHTLGRGMLTEGQITRLAKAIDPGHVENKRGLSYIAQHEARAEMTRIFGFGGWDSQVDSMELLYQKVLDQNDPQYPKNGGGKPYYITAYRASVRVRVRDFWGMPIAEFVEYHVEENAPLPNMGEAHAMATTSVESYALRRALIGLGDRLGLGLYDKGSTAPLVKGTLQITELRPKKGPAQKPQTPVSGPNVDGQPLDTQSGEIGGDAGAQPQPDPRLQGVMNPGSNG